MGSSENDYKQAYKVENDSAPFFTTTSDGSILPRSLKISTDLPLGGDAPAQAESPSSSPIVHQQDGFANQLGSILGSRLDPDMVRQLRLKSDGNVQRAVNFYFEELAQGPVDNTADQAAASETKPKRKSPPTTALHSPKKKKDAMADTCSKITNFLVPDKFNTLNGEVVDDVPAQGPVNQDVQVNTAEPTAQSVTATDPTNLDSWTDRLLGSTQAEVWTTRSGKNLVSFGDTLRFERGASHVHLDNVVRVINNRNNMEFARLTEADSKFAAVLMDTKVCSFQGSCIYADETLRPGDYVVIELHCYLLRSAFTFKLTQSEETQKTFFDNSKESNYEKLLRFKQEGLKLLFQKLNLSSPDGAPVTQPDASNPDSEDGGDITLEELNTLYQRSDTPATSLTGVDPPPSFAYQLRDYQRKGLEWMLARESPDTEDPRYKDPELSEPLDPLWQKISWPHDSGHFYINFHNGELSLTFPNRKSTALGGILADEMGLGKTISTLSLIHSSRESTSSNSEANFARKTTLIVAPMSLLAQWESEAIKTVSSSSPFNVFVCYGVNSQQRLRDVIFNPLNPPDIILTSYGTLHNDHKKLMKFRADNELDEFWYKDNRVSNFGLFGMKFHRIVLDEGHNIRNRTTIAAKACNDLRGEKKWILTGTPVVNKLEDLYSLIKFLGIEPWNNFSLWRASVTMPFQSKNKGSRGSLNALKVVQNIMERILLRRTKDMQTIDGQPLVALPPKTVTIDRVEFSDDEQALYSWIYAKVKGSFRKSLDQGQGLRNYTTILAQILRLRQACCHPSLVLNISKFQADDAVDETLEDEKQEENTKKQNIFDYEDGDLKKIIEKFSESNSSNDDANVESNVTEFGTTVATQILEGLKSECPICTEEIAEYDAAVTNCFHVACLNCLLEHISYQKNKGLEAKCPICRQNITGLYTVQRHGAEVLLRKYRSSGQSAKIRALIGALRRSPVREKVVVFSQFTGFLDLIENELKYNGFPTLRFDGSLSQKDRVKVLDRFDREPKPYILLISLKAGGVGLNLVCARQAFIMDPWWSFAIESQAIDRIHRMGQTRDVTVSRFIVQGSVEERMLKIQDRKAHLAVTLGMSKEEQKERRLEDIKLLFED